MRKLRVLVAEDHERLRRRLARLLDGEFEVVGSVPDGARLIESAISLNPDVIVSDVVMPVLTGSQAMRFLMATGHHIPWVLVSAATCDPDEWIRQGATAFIDKTDLGCELLCAIRSAACGRIYVSRNARSLLYRAPIFGDRENRLRLTSAATPNTFAERGRMKKNRRKSNE